MIAVQTSLGVRSRLGVEPDLEQGPGGVQHHVGVAASKRGRLRQRSRLGDPAGQPGGLGDVEPDDLRQRLREGIRIGPVGVGGSGPDRRDVTRVPALVDELCQVAEAAVDIGREHDRGARRPGAVDQAARSRAERRERDRDGRPARPRGRVEGRAQRIEVDAQRRERPAVDVDHALERERVPNGPIGLTGPPPPVPWLDRRLAPLALRRRHRVAPRLEGGDGPPLDVAIGQPERPLVGGDGGVAGAQRARNSRISA